MSNIEWASEYCITKFYTVANIFKNFIFSSANSTVKNITHVLTCLPDIYSYRDLEREC